MKHLFSPLVVACEIPHNSSGAHTFTQSSLSLQFIYETNENGDKVILGKGTYGVVYAGRGLSNQVRIAIKEIPEKDSTYEKPSLALCFIQSHPLLG